MAQPTASQITQVEQDLIKSVSDLTGRSADDVKALAKSFAGDIAQWGLDLAMAKASGDAAAVQRLEQNLVEVKDLLVLKAAEYAIDLQSVGEGAAIGLIRAAVSAL